MNIEQCTAEVEHVSPTQIRASLIFENGLTISVFQTFPSEKMANHHLRGLILLPVFDIAQRLAHCVVGGNLI